MARILAEYPEQCVYFDDAAILCDQGEMVTECVAEELMVVA